MSVIDLDSRRGPFVAGPVVCARCLHAWLAVRPITHGHDAALECPRCGAMDAGDVDYHQSSARIPDDCCGQVDINGVCAAPACIRGDWEKRMAAARRAWEMEAPVRLAPDHSSQLPSTPEAPE